MGTVCEVAIDGPQAERQIDAAFAEAARIESKISTWIADSELSRVNRGAEPSEELRALLDTTLEWSRKTNRAFDPRWKDGAQFEEGGFGKGYAIDRMMALLDAPHMMINFGGQLATRGSMRVTIADPIHRDQPILELTLDNASLSTSSNSERLHIVDPRTHEPVPVQGSASVIASDALTADILSTALLVMGADEGLRWANANGVAAIFITNAKQIRLSTRARDCAVKVIDGHLVMKD
jgi:thiamine biosynthesis lipoprotein